MGDWENSSKDWMQDYSGAKRQGKSVSDYEDTARDRLADVAGERRMKADESKADDWGPKTPSKHHQGIPAFKNAPKTSHGFGHTSKDGHLRNSGVPGAHRIGCKK